jgi:hypothetical protein
MGAKKPVTFRMSNEHRVKIQNSNILRSLINHVEGKQDMSASQVTAGLGLLDRILPKLSQTTIQGDSDDGAILIKWQK